MEENLLRDFWSYNLEEDNYLSLKYKSNILCFDFPEEYKVEISSKLPKAFERFTLEKEWEEIKEVKNYSNKSFYIFGFKSEDKF